eukprot:6922074-Prymnesium_polylepis.1
MRVASAAPESSGRECGSGCEGSPDDASSPQANISSTDHAEVAQAPQAEPSRALKASEPPRPKTPSESKPKAAGACYFEADGTRVGFDEAGDTPAFDVNISSYKYGTREVLHDVSFSIPQGARVGLLGKSGAGKSTLLNILTRLYALGPSAGLVKMLGSPICDAIISEFQSTLEQVPAIFDGTVRDNLLMGISHVDRTADTATSNMRRKAIVDETVPDALLREVCIKARFWDDLCNMPGQLDAPVGVRGKNMSVGQRQRLCLARALLRQSAILILDEPVSAQDPQTVDDVSEMLCWLTYRSKWGGKHPVTTLAITHNLKFLETFTHIVFVANGTVVEFGTKEQLIKKKGHYYRRVVLSSGISIDARGRANITPERLRMVWLFNSAPSVGLQDMSRLFATRHFRFGDILTDKGTDADSMYILVSGTLKADEYTDGDDTLSWSPGQEIGVDALLDNVTIWKNTIRVNSDSAVLLELLQTDFEALITHDEGLAESIGHTVREINALRSSRRLQMLWPFFDASLEDLEAVSSAFNIHTVEEGVGLCDRDQKPSDPCKSLYLVAMGRIGILNSTLSGQKTVDVLARGGVIGELEMGSGNGQAPPVVEQARDNHQIVRVKASEFSVVLELSRGKVKALMEEHPALAATYQKNVELWDRAVDPDVLSRNWFFGSCHVAIRRAVYPHWKPRVCAEGSIIVSEDPSTSSRDYCYIVLSGVVVLKRQRVGLKKLSLER